MVHAATIANNTTNADGIIALIIKALNSIDLSGTIAEKTLPSSATDSPEDFAIKLTGFDASGVRGTMGSGFIMDKNVLKNGQVEYVVATAGHVASELKTKSSITTPDGKKHAVTEVIMPKKNPDGSVVDVGFVKFKTDKNTDYPVLPLTTADKGDKIVIAGFPGAQFKGLYTESPGTIYETNNRGKLDGEFVGQTVLSTADVYPGQSGGGSYEKNGGKIYANGLVSLRIQPGGTGANAGSVDATTLAKTYKDLTGDTSVTVKEGGKSEAITLTAKQTLQEQQVAFPNGGLGNVQMAQNPGGFNGGGQMAPNAQGMQQGAGNNAFTSGNGNQLFQVVSAMLDLDIKVAYAAQPNQTTAAETLYTFLTAQTV